MKKPTKFRDQMAAAALTGWLANPSNPRVQILLDDDSDETIEFVSKQFELIALTAYDFADAMLAARDKWG